MRPGEIFLARFPFGDVPGMKLRPSDLFLDPSTPEFSSTRLKVASTLRLHKLATIHSSSLARYLGAIDSATLATGASKLKQLLTL
jgi:mRNA interferase MazF